MTSKEMLNRCEDYAKNVHAHQRRKGGAPYSEHLAEVVRNVTRVFEELGIHDSARIRTGCAAAWLHDAIEDTDATYDTISFVSNSNIADMVAVLSDDKRKPKAIRDNEFKTALAKASVDIQAVKLADIQSNVFGFSGKENVQWKKKYLPRLLDKIKCLTKVSGTSLYKETVKEIEIQVHKDHIS